MRIAAIEAIGFCSYQDIVARLGASGGISSPGSLLQNLTDRVKDKKHPVRVEAMTLLGKLWGVAVRDIASGNEVTRDLLGPIPSRILDAVYVNDCDVNVLVDRVWWESLMPLGWPIYRKTDQKGSKQQKEADADNDEEMSVSSADKLRAERLLWLVADLEDKAKVVFHALMLRPSQQARYMMAFLKACEDYNVWGH